jgi:hypothetical protein
VASLSAALDALPVFLREGSEKAMKQLHTKGTI